MKKAFGLEVRANDDFNSYPAASELPGGRWRVRCRSVRGFKTWPGLVSAFTLCNSPIV